MAYISWPKWKKLPTVRTLGGLLVIILIRIPTTCGTRIISNFFQLYYFLHFLNCGIHSLNFKTQAVKVLRLFQRGEASILPTFQVKRRLSSLLLNSVNKRDRIETLNFNTIRRMLSLCG